VRKQMGEIVIDHRASPGLPEDIARQAGYDPRLCREGKMYEAATMACGHCLNVIIKNPFRTRDRHYCSKCGGHFICDPCAYLVTLPDYIHNPRAKFYDDFKDGKIVNGTPTTLLTPEETK